MVKVNVVMLCHGDADQVQIPHGHFVGGHNRSTARDSQLRSGTQKEWWFGNAVKCDLLDKLGLWHIHGTQ